ncbi:Mgm101p-domain-containing protein [Pseudovirgaria hyperparasitica]|uniref:Mitochondrial genome maintenance protein MGM101 n=1 Tax=Pseudovirgaria hyperparasitica TaxID=470096 RepID=A0A6A6WH49_9PEZI|nr:Mgm101p-domain-containing protein [Pseudovirgaria hyperparasitica]KAF2761415.1 Mgm101p-domain-containing protein [Pseudovirgaria hyperparasitica]
MSSYTRAHSQSTLTYIRFASSTPVSRNTFKPPIRNATGTSSSQSTTSKPAAPTKAPAKAPAPSSSQAAAPAPATAKPAADSSSNNTHDVVAGRFRPVTAEPLPPTSRNEAATSGTHDLSEGLVDSPPPPDPSAQAIDWSRTYHGLGDSAFPPQAAEVLLAPLNPDDVEIKPDGIIYLPEIKYRRILNKAFGPGSWGLAPRGESIVTGKLVTREYGLVVGGRLVSVARGEMQYFDPDGIPTAVEGCKSNALMRCCKDLGIASELWDPRFIRKHLAEYGREAWVEHVTTKRKKKIMLRKDDQVRYPFKETVAGK